MDDYSKAMSLSADLVKIMGELRNETLTPAQKSRLADILEVDVDDVDEFLINGFDFSDL